MSSLFLSTFGGCVSRTPLSCRKFLLWKIMESPWQEGITRLRVDNAFYATYFTHFFNSYEIFYKSRESTFPENLPMRQWEGIIVPFARHFYLKLGAGEHNATLYEGGSPSCSPAIRGRVQENTTYIAVTCSSAKRGLNITYSRQPEYTHRILSYYLAHSKIPHWATS